MRSNNNYRSRQNWHGQTRQGENNNRNWRNQYADNYNDRPRRQSDYDARSESRYHDEYDNRYNRRNDWEDEPRGYYTDRPWASRENDRYDSGRYNDRDDSYYHMNDYRRSRNYGNNSNYGSNYGDDTRGYNNGSEGRRRTAWSEQMDGSDRYNRNYEGDYRRDDDMRDRGYQHTDRYFSEPGRSDYSRGNDRYPYDRNERRYGTETSSPNRNRGTGSTSRARTTRYHQDEFAW